VQLVHGVVLASAFGLGLEDVDLGVDVEPGREEPGRTAVAALSWPLIGHAALQRGVREFHT